MNVNMKIRAQSLRNVSGLIKLLNNPIYIYGLFVFIFILLVGAVWIWLPEGWDWPRYFRPAILEMISGQSPYTIQGYFNPPWTLIPLLPLLLLPEKLACALLTVIGIMVFALIGYKFHAKPLALAAFLLSPYVLYGAFSTNIDWLAAFGLLLPPEIGLFFVLTKPQIGAAVAIYWLFETWKSGGWRNIIRVFSPVMIAFLISFLVYGFWPSNAIWRVDHGTNMSLWPTSIPIGLVVLSLAIRKKEKRFAISASPFLSPYISPHSWATALIGLLPMQTEMILAVIGSWIVYIYFGLT